ncbi:MAG: Ribosomal RNA small subunit methyltransferase I [Microgenomates group bacterium GW2011_GWA1_48_10]|uniref:Ribosomal RNA small subunit methyltransferase I n=1 Tax=Candidatus Gottesmanbacteria bacterium RIFCSPHIGHO2_01_FULL_47_48 TaxID=1798381 RepID=A0A1F5ZZ22_9BACT|nr:MAG: Ribosomal RNA small subunit methyltransferase I [Microgenomates group bacterium GW2011_GWA1_48_10]OGG17726.1 MAG: 16S rRNA (cytidine(1402)-2'-O)-methyltransferase [Candidatus Gottesmanbacteria bacterium RIFCSPHIGHO2_01_FULL_47_48]
MLYLVSTPIGNLEDITLRAIRVLREADVIIAEDTRHTGLLLRNFDISHKPMVSLYDEVEVSKIDEILRQAQDKAVALVSDAGTPLVSDPGYKLVREALKAGVEVVAIPGPTALVTALTVSGLPPDKFLFLGYPPEKESHQRELFEKLGLMSQMCPMSFIFYVSPYKLEKNLRNLGEVLGDIEVVVARELTKVYEEVWHGRVSEAMAHFKEPKGEMVLMFHL